MPIRQPAQMIIRANDFESNAFNFAVESVLDMQANGDELLVSASAGYLLTTLADSEPKPEQAIEHVQQTSGQWIANTNVTVMREGDSVVDGTVVIRNPLDETVVLTIDGSSYLVKSSQIPALSISHSALTFTPTVPNKPTFLILTIAQQEAEMPVTITTDAPAYFQLASDSHPTFTDTLTLMPSAPHTYVHVRYAAPKRGRHTGHLFLQTPYDTQTVTLEGRSEGSLSALFIPKSEPTSQLKRLDVPKQLPPAKVPSSRWIGPLAILVAGGLAYGGYTYRCQLFPSLCQESNPTQTVGEDQESVSDPAMVKEATKSIDLTSDRTNVKKARKRELPPADPADQTRLTTPADNVINQSKRKGVTKSDPTVGNTPVNQSPSVKTKVNPRPLRSTSSIEESELERELNQKP